MTCGHVFLFTVLIWLVIWALFGWHGVFIFAGALLLVGGIAVAIGSM